MQWSTRLLHDTVEVPDGFRSLATPVYRGSTTLFPRASDVRDDWRPANGSYSYGLYGTPTTLELAARVASLEGGFGSTLAPGGQAAIALVYLSLTSSGEHVLLPESIYGPHRAFADDIMSRFGLVAEYYDPLDVADLKRKLRQSTRLVWCESPGSVTMEVQDVPAIVSVAHAHGSLVVLDSTYGAGILFKPFDNGVDVTVHALTKYVGGHSDLLLGSVTVAREELHDRMGTTAATVGMAVSPDDCALALRGLQTLALRLTVVGESSQKVASWLDQQPEVETVLHPALPSCPGHCIWERDFRGASGVFSIVFDRSVGKDGIFAFLDRLRLFDIGYSWGGTRSLVVPYFDLARSVRSYGDRLVRFYVGLEDSSDLIADLEQGLDAMRYGEPSLR